MLAIIVAFSTITTTSYSQIRLGLRGGSWFKQSIFLKDAIEVENLNSFKLGPTVEVILPAMNFGVEASVLYNNDRMDVAHVHQVKTMKRR